MQLDRSKESLVFGDSRKGPMKRPRRWKARRGATRPPGGALGVSRTDHTSTTHALDGALVRLTTINELCDNPVRLSNKSHQLLCKYLIRMSVYFLLLCYKIGIYARNRKRGD